MPIDSSIALGVKPVQLESPMNQMANLYQMQGAQQANQLNQMKMDEYKRGLGEAESWKQSMQGINGATPEGQQTIYNALLRRGDTEGANKFMKDIAETTNLGFTGAKTQADTQKLKNDLRAATLRDASRNPSDANLTAHVEDVQLSPLYSPEEKASSQRMLQQLLAMPIPERQAFLASQGATASDLKPTTRQQDLGGSVQEISYPAYGGAATVVPGSSAQMQPYSAEVEAQKARLAAKGASTVSVNTGGQTEKAKVIGKLMGTKQVENFEAAQAVPSSLQKVDETLSLLRNSDINTGIGATLINTLDRTKAKFAADKKAGVRVSNTEYLNSLLGSEVFPLIQSLGIGARGMDTPAEREFLREVMTGTISLDKNTLIRMAELRKKAMVNTAKEYNKRVDSGEYDDFFNASGMNKAKITLPSDGAAIKAGVVQDGYRFKGGNAGDPANWEKL